MKVALTRFIRTLPWARRTVRSLTHTLHLPPAHAEIYNGPHADWLREVLEGLPNLQSLVVRGLPFFDHAALNALRYARIPGNRSELVPARQPFGLRLLDASRCSNVTATGLLQSLRRFDSLLYLDLSWTYPAKDPEILRSLSRFRGLQALKLRGISLKDDDVSILANAIKTRVRSLDLRNNQLTDRSVRILLQNCFTLPLRRHSDGQVMSPSLLPYLGAEMLAIYRGANFEAFLRKEFTDKFVGRLAIEDAPESGITHLYISDNHLTVEGLSGLVRSGRLHVLDAGSLAPLIVSHTGSFSMDFPSLAKLTPVLAESASHSLTYLRLDHSLITKELSTSSEPQSGLVPGYCELADTSGFPPGTAELESGNEVFELAGDNRFPVEATGDPIHIVVTPTPGDKATPDESTMQSRRGSRDLPIPVESEETTENGLHVSSIEQEDDASSAIVDQTLTPGPTISHRGRGRSYSSVVQERKGRVQTHLTEARGFHPGMLPHLTTLILTELPSSSPTLDTPSRLISFIRSCAEETTLAKLQAQLDWTLPPGRRASPSHQRELSRKSFALEQLVLEIAPQSLEQKTSDAASAWRHRSTKSVTQDQDSEALWAASQTDFSFFGEGETNSLDATALEPVRPPTSMMGGMEVCGDTAPQQRTKPSNQNTDASAPRIDVVAEVAKFRKSTRAAYQARLAAGEANPDVDGFWEGNVKVVRRPHDVDPRHEDDEVWADYYGNRFSNGYLYR